MVMVAGWATRSTPPSASCWWCPRAPTAPPASWRAADGQAAGQPPGRVMTRLAVGDDPAALPRSARKGRPEVPSPGRPCRGGACCTTAACAGDARRPGGGAECPAGNAPVAPAAGAAARGAGDARPGELHHRLPLEGASANGEPSSTRMRRTRGCAPTTWRTWPRMRATRRRSRRCCTALRGRRAAGWHGHLALRTPGAGLHGADAGGGGAAHACGGAGRSRCSPWGLRPTGIEFPTPGAGAADLGCC
jgi:hypothetical protein